MSDKPNKIKRTRSMRIMNMHIPSHILLCVWSVIALFPIYIMIINSFKSRYTIYENPFALPETWNFKNYRTMLSDSAFLNYFKNSFVVVVLSLFLVLVIGSLAAYALAHWKGKTSKAIYLFLIVGMMLPIKIASIRLLEIVRALGLLNTIWALVPVYTAMGLPIAVFVLTSFVRSLPQELYEAGYVDGAGRFHIFWRIVIPLLKPALATVAIYNLVPFWNDLWFPLIFITKESAKTLLLGVTKLQGQYSTDWSKILVVLTLSSLPVMLLYITMSKQFIKGLTAGAVKG